MVVALCDTNAMLKTASRLLIYVVATRGPANGPANVYLRPYKAQFNCQLTLQDTAIDEGSLDFVSYALIV